MRRRRSPGLESDFSDLPTADFKRPLDAREDGARPKAGADVAAGYGIASPIHWTDRGGQSMSIESDQLQARLAQLERSNEQLVTAVADLRARAEAAEKGATEARARDEALSRRLAALEARI